MGQWLEFCVFFHRQVKAELIMAFEDGEKPQVGNQNKTGTRARTEKKRGKAGDKNRRKRRRNPRKITREVKT